MKNIQKIINLKTTFNSKNLPKINTYTHKSNETFPTPLHGYFEYSEIPSPERKVLFIRCKYLKTNQINFGLINAFLENNIFKIEKILNNFVKKINLIIECKSFLTVSLSIKKNNHK